MQLAASSIRERAIFVDSSAFLAVVASDDDFHQQALSVIRRCARERYSLVTTHYVIVETYAGLIGTVGPREARASAKRLGTDLCRPVRGADLKRAEMILFQYEDKDYSYCDAISFAVMERLHLGLAFAFDNHFRQHGFSTPLDRQDWP